MTTGQDMLAASNMVRVGKDEVYVRPNGDVCPAMLGVIWEVNRVCAERGLEPVFGEPKLSGDEYRDVEEYEHARVVYVKDKRDGTVRIVAKDDLGRELLAEAWDRIHDRVLLARYAQQQFPEVNPEHLKWYLNR